MASSNTTITIKVTPDQFDMLRQVLESAIATINDITKVGDTTLDPQEKREMRAKAVKLHDFLKQINS